ncbi:MAG: PqqD family protein [Phycisphaerales bacterium]|nr:PqqD family protein [Phycisphaerales bacterium]
MTGVERGGFGEGVATPYTAIGAATIPPRRADVLCVPIDDEAVLYDHVTDTTFRLNETGFAIWRFCDGRNTMNDVVESIRATYDVDEATARDDVGAAVSEMARTGIIGCNGA